MTTPQTYLATARGILDHLETTQLTQVEAAADLVVHALLHGGTVNCSEIGHGIQWDFINRAGGLLAVQPFSHSLTVNNPMADGTRKARTPQPDDRDLEQIRAAVQLSSLKAGDVMIISSVSGKNRGPVELALACRARGVKVIVFTAMTYTMKVTSLHPSGKRLFEVGDVVVDCGAPYGDAAVDIPGFENKAIPVSGLGQVVSGWMIWGRVMEKMAAAGTPPSVFISHNREGGPEYNERQKKTYQERGF